MIANIYEASTLPIYKRFLYSASIVYSFWFEMVTRVSHLQFFLISLLFQAGIYPRHTKEQENYRSYMFFVYIFQRFLTFVSLLDG